MVSMVWYMGMYYPKKCSYPYPNTALVLKIKKKKEKKPDPGSK